MSRFPLYFSRKEAEKAAREVFQDCDKTSDNKLSQKEMTRYLQDAPWAAALPQEPGFSWQAVWGRSDADGNGRIDQEQWVDLYIRYIHPLILAHREQQLSTEMESLRAEVAKRESEKQKRLRLIDTMNTQAAAARNQQVEKDAATRAEAEKAEKAYATLISDCEALRQVKDATREALVSLEEAHRIKSRRLETLEKEHDALRMQTDDSIAVLTNKVACCDAVLVSSEEANTNLKQHRAQEDSEASRLRGDLQATLPSNPVVYMPLELL